MAGIMITYPNDYVYYIVDKNSKYATIMKKNIRDLTIYEIEGIDKKRILFLDRRFGKNSYEITIQQYM